MQEFVGPESRSSLSLGNGNMVFKWEPGDAITVFAKENKNAVQIYKLSEGAGGARATFSAQNFQMTKDQLYYAFSKAKGDASNVKITDYDDIIVDYNGQIQYGNAGTTHLGDYDFQAAAVLCDDASRAHFQFNSLGATLRLVITFDPAFISDPLEIAALNLESDIENPNLKMLRFTELELFDKKNEYRQTHRTFSFSAGTSTVDDKDTYTATWPSQNIQEMDRFKVLLRSGGANDEGVTRFMPMGDGASNPNHKLVVYIEVPPHYFLYDTTNPNHNPLNILLKGYYEKLVDGVWVKVPVSYVYEHKLNLTIGQGKAHQINFTPQKPENFEVTLNVNHNWQHGDVVDNTSSAKSRATGDPGYDDKIHLPKYIHYIYCHDGKVVKSSHDGDAKAFTTVTDIPNVDWSTRKEDNGDFISTYIGNDGAVDGVVTLTKYNKSEPGHVDHGTSPCTYHLYVVASNVPLVLPESIKDTDYGIKLGTPEATIRDLLYSIGGTDKQVFMRDLYSTPWDDDNFEGNLVDAVQDITMYHVAAMVDVKWNTVNTAIANVSAKTVKDTGLYLFKPTENAYGTGSYTATNSVEADQSNLGRTVFYLPQFKAPNCQYNIGFNSEAAIPVTFTPDVSKGYTSWLRWLKKKN